MKKTVNIFCLLILLAGCKSTAYVQLYEVAAVNSSQTNGVYTYKNDTLQIDYIFWADNGLMKFRIYNASSKPIYIDWYKSSYISNSSRYQYWTDKVKTESSFNAVAVSSYRYSPLFPTVTGYSGGSVSSQTKQERISFIPPRSYIERTGYSLKKDYFNQWGKDYTKKIEPRFDRPKIKTTVSTKDFTRENSPLDFRNFLTFSFKEDFSSEFYVDNEYYVKSISVMDKYHFWTPGPDENGNYYTRTRFQKLTDFFITTY